ncbi:TetR/AcrR family transcriptional regulator [Brachybacterium huguangmaarense]
MQGLHFLCESHYAHPMTTHPAPDVDPEGLSLRERKKRRTRAAMHRAAIDLVAEHGVAGVTVEMIAERAGVSERTFFNYWPSKESAMLGMPSGIPERTAALLTERPADESPRDALRAVMVEMARSLYDDSELRAAKRAVILREPALQEHSARQMASLHQGLIDALAARYEGPDTHERALVAVHLAFAASRSAFSLSMSGALPLADAFERVYAYIDSGAVAV